MIASYVKVRSMIEKFASLRKLAKFKQINLLLILLASLILGACTSSATLEAEQAAIEQERVAAMQETARIAAEESRQRAAVEERERQSALAEQRRLQAERERQAVLARARAQAEAELAQTQAQAEAEVQAQAEQAERQVQSRRQAIARAQAEQDQKLARIEELESQIAALENNASTVEQSNTIYQEAILVAEELIDVLATEQAKYENVDAAGNTVEPLAKDRIEELEERKNTLMREAQVATQ
jgi:hypothetical protein